METSKDANDQDMKDDTEALWESLAHGQQSHGKIQETEWGSAISKRQWLFFSRIAETYKFIYSRGLISIGKNSNF